MKAQTYPALALLLVSSFSYALGQTGDKRQPSPLQRRATEVCALFRATPGEYEKSLAPDFLSKIPPNQLIIVLKQFFTQLGRCGGVLATDHHPLIEPTQTEIANLRDAARKNFARGPAKWRRLSPMFHGALSEVERID